MKSSAPKIYRLGFWANVLLRNRFIQIAADNERITLAGRNQHIDIGYDDLCSDIELKPGVIWSELVFRTGSHGTISFDGIINEIAHKVTKAIRDWFREHGERSLEERAAPLLEAQKAIIELLSQQSYVRNSVVQRHKTFIQPSLTIAQDPLWEDFALPHLREAVDAVKRFCEETDALVKAANDAFLTKALERFQRFFDSVESRPLTASQRRACLVNEDNNLVLAGAGTGKTSTMMGRAGYLVASCQAEPEKILMLAFARKAAEEMQERLDLRLKPFIQHGMPTVKTFHALGKEIIAKVEGKQPSLTPMAEDGRLFAAFIDKVLEECLKDSLYRSELVKYFTCYLYPYRNPFDFKDFAEYNTYIRKHEIRTLQGEVVKSFEECEIANFLYQHGIEYRYEEPYKINTAGPDYRQYRPDFYLPEHEIYIEHFALNEKGVPPPFIDATRYLEGIRWKRQLHTRHQTTLLETFSFEKRKGTLLVNLTNRLQDAGVALAKRPDEELLSELREKGEISSFSELLAKFLKLLKAAHRQWEELAKSASSHVDRERLLVLLKVFRPIYDKYQAYLSSRQEIDFEDMIGRAIQYVETGRYLSPYTHILVDEFQDISPSRARLVETLLRQREESVLFCVGDDWQAIYRFTGSDIGITRNFADHFGTTAISVLDTTFRFNNKIGDVASHFVTKNPAQLKKRIGSINQVSLPAVSLVRIATQSKGISLALEAIQDRGKEASVLVLARNNFQIAEWRALKAKRELKEKYPDLSIEFMTVHASKGKEADYVIVIGLEKGKYGFPSEKVNDALLEFLLPELEPFAFSEERRLFYVALTRARDRVYLVYNVYQSSSFIKELDRGGYEICRDEFQSEDIQPNLTDIPCPKCEQGSLIPKSGKNGKFAGCNHYPYCKYTERLCGDCGSVMERTDRFKICGNPNCNYVDPICPVCGGIMLLRRGPYGEFWGCKNYRRNTDFPCTHKEKYIDLTQAGRDRNAQIH